jgi:hypothetical protein
MFKKTYCKCLTQHGGWLRRSPYVVGQVWLVTWEQ